MSFDPDQVKLPLGSFIAGVLREGDGEELGVQRPSDNIICAKVREASAALVDEAVMAARHAAEEKGWRRSEPRQRSAVMRRWADLVEKHSDELARLEALSSSRVIGETRVRDIVITAELIRFYAECADKFESGVLPSRHDVLALTVDEPYGVVAAISPWNVPLVLAAVKVAPALAAGNAVVLKPSELTPFSVLRLAELACEAGLPKGLFNVVFGTGSVTGAALVRHPGIDYVTFTGSTQTGARIMSDAAHHGLKPVSLELGGKNPNIVFDDAGPLDKVADMLAAGVARNAGQLCYCGSRLLVQRAIADELVDRVKTRLARVSAGPTWDDATTLAPIISAAQAERIQRIVETSVAEGAELVMGGEPLDIGAGQFFSPTILQRLSMDNIAVREEVFGPVLAVEVFDTEEEAVQLAMHPVYGLAAGIHTRSIDRALRMARAVEAGMVWVNSYGRTLDIGLPFGGYKQSGFGKDFGVAAYKKYLKSKSIWIQMDTESAR
jgi:aldehyde dehydrogenase (NAD+)